MLVRGYVHDVVISCGAEVIARHPRSYEREDFVFDPLHYLALIERKINALDQAAPLAGWWLPEEFMTLRRLLEARMGKQGKREFVQVLRLMEVFSADEVAAAVRNAIARGAIGFDAVKHLVLCHIERRPPRLDMTIYPYLPRAHVAMTSAKTYLGLLTGTEIMTDAPQLLLAHHLKALKLPTFLREYDKLARQCAAEGLDHTRYLLRLAELELIDRQRRMVERRIKEARFPSSRPGRAWTASTSPPFPRSWDMCLSRRPAPSCCSRCSASVMSAVQPSSPQTCRLTNGPACSVPSGLRVRCSTGLPITSISWK